jgi:hypothetical protein
MKNMVTIVMLFALLAVSCKQPTAPKPERTVRDYTWTKTTLGDGTYQIVPIDIWGSSPKDVYVVGHASEWLKGKIWHFDGAQWSDISEKYVEAFIAAYQGEKFLYHWSPQGVWGFGADDVWIAGARDTTGGLSEGFVLRYNGKVWREIPINSTGSLYCIWGTSPNDVWVGGRYGRFFHYDGSGWAPYAVADSIIVNFFGGNVGSKVYAIGANLGGGIVYDSLLEWDGVTWRVVDVSPDGVGLFGTVDVVEGTLYTARDSAVRKRLSDGSWSLVFTVPGVTLARVKGTSESNLIAVGGKETVLHFDGKDARRITQFSDPDIGYQNIFLFEDEVFIKGSNTGASYGYILHGK